MLFSGEPISGSWLGALNTQIQRYQWLLWLALLALLAVGFDFQTPAAQFRTLQAKNAVQDTAIAELDHYVRALVVGQCLDRPPRETQLMGIDCIRLLGRRP